MKQWSRDERYKKIEEVNEEYLIELEKKVNSCPFRQKYHIQPKTGLLNDPNGFTFYNGEYHLFYQWFPLGPVHGIKYWYHLSSKDLITWEDRGIGIKPDKYYDSHGAFSGSGMVFNNKLYLLYTGNTRNENWERKPYQCLAIMDEFNKINKLPKALIEGAENGYTEHFRDPKIFKKEDEYFIIIGAENHSNKGRVVLYNSKDLIKWNFKGEIKTKLLDFGYMWECPDYLELEDKGILIFSPQGLEKSEDKYNNIYQNGYIVGEKINFENLEFNHKEFIELDNGFDFYASQTMEDEKGRRILVGWMGLPEIQYPTDRNQWSGCLTIPREIKLKGKKLTQKPIEELKNLRKNKRVIIDELIEEEKEFEGFLGKHYELICEIEAFKTGKIGLKLRVSENEETLIYYDIEEEKIILDRSKSGESFANEWGTVRKAEFSAEKLKLRVFMDSSSVEIFINDGELTFTSRIFPSENSKGIKFFTTNRAKIRAEIWDLQ